MKVRVIDIVFIILFMVALILPLAFVNLYGGEVSEQENRVLAARPPISDAFQHPADFIERFDQWLNDNLGFRDSLLGYYGFVKKLENNTQYTDGSYIMLIGKEGHHYFADINGWLIEKFQGKTYLDEEQLRELASGLENVNHYLAKKGIPLIVMFCVDKETIYPEYYPKSIKRGPDPIQLDIITDYIIKHTDIDIFNIKENLLSQKDTYLVFDKNGDSALSHYNEIGAFFAYQELMQHITAYMPEIKAFSIDDVAITYSDTITYKNVPDVQLKSELTYERVDDIFFEGVPLGHPSEGVAFRNKDSTLPTVLFMRDSYSGNGNYLSRYIPEHFKESVFIHWSNMENFDAYIEHFKPDIVIFESAERAISSFAGSLSNLRDLGE